MKRHLSLYILICVFALAGAGWAIMNQYWFSGRPMPDFNNMPSYILAVDRSKNPQIIAIRKEIAAGPANLARQETLCVAAGIPVTSAAQKMPPASENAAPLYEQWQAIQVRKHITEAIYTETLGYRYHYTPAEIAGAEQFYSGHPNALRLMNRAAKKPVVAFAGDHVQPYEMLSATQREVARRYVTESYLQAHSQHYAQAIATQIIGFNIAQQAAREPFLFGVLTAQAIDEVSLGGMENILYLAGPNASVDMMVQKAILRDSPKLSASRSMARETPYLLKQMDIIQTHPEYFHWGSNGYQTHKNHFNAAQRIFLTDLADAVKARYLALIRQAIPTVDLPPAQNQAIFNRLSYATDANGHPLHVLNPVKRLLDIFTQRNFESITNSGVKAHAMEEVVMAAAAVLAVKARTGAFPAALPGRFIDPATGKPLSYRLEGKNGFVVRSAYKYFPDEFDMNETDLLDRPVFFRYPGPPLKPVPVDELK